VNRDLSRTPSLTTLFLGGAFLWALTRPLLSGDLGWHIRVGQYVLDRHAVPHTNFLCFTAPWSHWLTHEWLADVLFALLDAGGGLPALFLVRGLLFVTTLFLLLKLGRRTHAEPLALAGLLFFTGITLALNVALRPWMFSNLLLVVELLVLDQARDRPEKRWIRWCVVALLGLWVNLHGGFALGLGLLLLELLFWVVAPAKAPGQPGTVRRFLEASCLGVCAFLVLIPNPHGMEALVLPIDYLLGEQRTGLALIGAIKEWSPIELGSFFGGVYLVWCLLGALALLVSPEIRRRPAAWIGLVFLAFTLKAQRHLPVAALLLFPGVARGLLAPLSERLKQPSGRVGAYLAGLSRQEGASRRPFLAGLLVLIAGGYLTWSLQPGFDARAMEAKHYPLAAVQKLANLPPRRVFNHCDWAGLMAWKAPAWPLFITPVFDAYPREVLEDWLTIANLKPGWADLLKNRGVEAVFMPPDAALTATLKRTPGWFVVLEDREAVLLARTGLDLEEPLPLW